MSISFSSSFGSAMRSLEHAIQAALNQPQPQLDRDFVSPLLLNWNRGAPSGFFNHRLIEVNPLSDHHSLFSFIRPIGVRDGNEEIRRAFGIASGQEVYTELVAQSNEQRYGEAAKNNEDGKLFLKRTIELHLKTLSPDDQRQLRVQIEESDPEIFMKIPKLAIQRVLSYSLPLGKYNTPYFLRAHITELEAIRELAPSEKRTQRIDAIATQLARETDFIAALQGALEGF